MLPAFGIAGTPRPRVPPGAHDGGGRALPMTVLTAVQPPYRAPGGVWALRGVLFLFRTFPHLTHKIGQLSFIHFCRWVVIRRLPDDGGSDTRLDPPLLLFESNYNGDVDQYVDAFATILRRGVTAIWRTSYGIPGTRPVEALQGYIHANGFRVNHYYSAYPAATTTMIVSALALREPLDELTAKARVLCPARFQQEYRAFVTAMQEYL